MPFHGLGLELPYSAVLGTVGNTWVLQDPSGNKALLDWYNSQTKFFYNNALYSSDAALSTALGATGTWPKKKAGPNVFGSDLIQNGATPITSTTGWQAITASTALSTSAGNLLHTNNTGATTSEVMAQDPAGITAGSNYELKVTAASGVTRNIAIADSSTTILMLLGNAVAGNASYTYYFPDIASGTRLYLRSNGVANAAAAQWNGISLKECRPFSGWVPNGVTVAVRGTTPSSVVADQVLWEAGGLNEDNRLRIVYQTDGHLHLIGSRDGSGGAVQRFNIDIGAVATSTAFRVCISAKNGTYLAALNGLDVLTNTTADYPAGSIMYIGTDSANADWAGSIDRVTVFPSALGADGVSGLCNRGPVLLMMGDSYVAGAAGVGLAATAVTAGKAVCSPSSLAAGGTTDVAQLAALQAAPGYKNYDIIWCDGRANTGYDSTLYLQDQQTFASFIGHSRYIRVLPVTVPGDDAATQAKILATADALKAIIPAANYVDPRDVWSNTGGVIDASNLQVDGVHPTQPADDALWSAIDTKATALGMYSYVTP